MYKVALQLYGKLRFFDFQRKYWRALKIYFEQNDVQLDIHLTTWKEEEHNYIDNDTLFSDVNFIEVPDSGYTNRKFIGSNYKSIINSNTKSPCLYLSQYSMYKSYSNRIKWENKNGKEYDYIILTRPDYFINFELVLETIKENCNKNDYQILIGEISNPINKNTYPTLSSDDNIFFGSPQSINLFCTSYNYFYKQNHNHFLTHHTNYAISIQVFNMLYKNKPQGLILRTNEPHIDNLGQKKISMREYRRIQSLNDSTPSKND